MERCSRITADNYSDCSKDKKKEPWMTYNQVGRGSPLIGGFSWPPRSYYCGFCKREFKSAQALGGHMNVHRRDKARLRQSPPLGPLPFDLNPNPNLGSKPIPCSSTTIPNLNMPPPSSSSANKISLVTSTLPSMIPLLTNFYCSPSSDSRGDDLETMDKVKTSSGLGELKDLMEEGSSNEFQKGSKAVRLDLEIGINGDHTEDIDLELRLGYT